VLTAGSHRSSGIVLNIVGPATANARPTDSFDGISGQTASLKDISEQDSNFRISGRPGYC